MRHYERRLPHWDVVGEPLFVTFCLHDTLPVGRRFPPEAISSSGKAFAAMDHLLDKAEHGPRFLARPQIAEIVVNALQDGEKRFQRYELHAFVVMPNHVHAMVTPEVTSAEWLGPLKGFTSYRANELMGTHRRSFWQEESFDRVVRSRAEFESVRAYIEMNPVRAGLAKRPEEYRWSSAR